MTHNDVFFNRLRSKFILGVGHHSYSEFDIQKISLWGIRSEPHNKLQELDK
jgi:hypothetical protein